MKPRAALRSVALPSVLALVVATATTSVYAQTEPAPSGTEEFLLGRQRYEARAYGEALRALRASLALRSSPNTRLYLARALRELGRNGEAFREFQRATTEAEARASEEPRYAPTARAARAEGQALLSRIALLTVSVVDAPHGAEVRVQGEVLEPSAWGVPRAMDPGSVHVELSAPGRPSARATVDLTASNETRVALRLDAAPGASPELRIGENPETAPGPLANLSANALFTPLEGAPSPPPPPGWPRLALGLFVGGGVLLVGGSVAGILALSTHQALLNECALDAAGRCTQRPADVESRVTFGRTAGVLFTTGMALGGLVALAGLGVLWVDASSERAARRGAASTAPRLRLELDARGALSLQGTF